MDILEKLFDFFASLWLTVTVLLCGAAGFSLQLASVNLQQTFPQWQWLGTLASVDVFHSRVFIFLLVLFCLNLTLCCLKQARRTTRLYQYDFQDPECDLPTGSPALTATRHATVEKIAAAIATGFTTAVRTPRRHIQRPGEVCLYAEKGRYVPLAFFLAHISMLLLAVGLVLGAQGFQYYIDIARGQIIDPLIVTDGNRRRVAYDFGLQCENFTKIFHDNSTEVKMHKSTLSILQNGQKLSTQVVDFSTPLQFNGLDIYQHRFIKTIQHANIQVRGPDGTESVFCVKAGQTFQVPGTTTMIRAVSFSKNTLQLISPGPRARIWASRKATRFSVPALQQFSFRLDTYKNLKMSSLRIVRDPGKLLTWYSFIFMITGFGLMFFCSHDRVWASVRTGSDGCSVRIWIASSKNSRLLLKKIQTILNDNQ